MQHTLETEFGKSLHFVSTETGRVIVFPDILTTESVVLELMKLREAEDVGTHLDNEVVLQIAAKQIRSDIRNLKSKPWPPNLNELTQDLPPSLVAFLTALTTGTEDETDWERNQKKKRHVESVAQDCIYIVTGGRAR